MKEQAKDMEAFGTVTQTLSARRMLEYNIITQVCSTSRYSFPAVWSKSGTMLS